MTGSDSPNNTACTISAFAKPGLNRYHFVLTEGNTLSATACFNVQTGTVVSTTGTGSPTATISGPYGDGWYRCSLTYTTASTQNYINIQFGVGNDSGSVSYAGDGSSSIAVWGVQHEVGGYVTSFIPTHGVAVTRGVETVTIEGEEFSDFYNQEEGTLVLAASYLEDNRTGGIVTIDDTSNTSEYTEVGYRSGGGSSGTVGSYIRTDAGNDQYYKGFTSSATQGNEFKVALAYKDNDYASSVNGQDVDTDTSGTTSKVYDRLRFSDVDTVGVVGSGHYRRFIYYSKRLSNNQVVTLTS